MRYCNLVGTEKNDSWVDTGNLEEDPGNISQWVRSPPVLLLLLQDRTSALIPWVLFFQLIVPLSVTLAIWTLRSHHRPIDRTFQLGRNLCVVRHHSETLHRITVAEDLPGVPRLWNFWPWSSGRQRSSSCGLVAAFRSLAVLAFSLAWVWALPRFIARITTCVGGG